MSVEPQHLDMDDRGTAKLIGVVFSIAFCVGIIFVTLYVSAWFAGAIGLTDSPDLECGDVEFDEDRDVAHILLYEHDEDSAGFRDIHDGSVLIYADGTTETTGELDLSGYDYYATLGGIYLYEGSDDYVVVDLNRGTITVADESLEDVDVGTPYNNPREEYELYDECEQAMVSA